MFSCDPSESSPEFILRQDKLPHQPSLAKSMSTVRRNLARVGIRRTHTTDVHIKILARILNLENNNCGDGGKKVDQFGVLLDLIRIS